MSRNKIFLAIAALVVIVAAGAGAWFLWGKGAPAGDTTIAAAPAATAGGPAPKPVLVVIDRAAIMQYSKAGQDIGRQVQAFTQATRGELDGQLRALESQGKALQRDAATMTPDERKKRVADFESRQAALQKVVSAKDAQVKAAVEKGRQAMEKVLAPILESITKAHGVNLVLDKQAVLFATETAFDITPQVIAALNEKLPEMKIDFNAPPQNPAQNPVQAPSGR